MINQVRASFIYFILLRLILIDTHIYIYIPAAGSSRLTSEDRKWLQYIKSKQGERQSRTSKERYSNSKNLLPLRTWGTSQQLQWIPPHLKSGMRFPALPAVRARREPIRKNAQHQQIKQYIYELEVRGSILVSNARHYEWVVWRIQKKGTALP